MNFDFFRRPPLKPAADLRPKTYEFGSILLVDDDAALASALQWILADGRLFVDVALDAEDALTKIRVNTYSAIVCDMQLPPVLGNELYRQACALRSELTHRFIFITGHAKNPAYRRFLESCNLPCLQKPFPAQTLATTIRRLPQLMSCETSTGVPLRG